MPNSIKCSSGIYRNQPGRIENFIPGRSSVVDKERKEVSMISFDIKYITHIICLYVSNNISFLFLPKKKFIHNTNLFNVYEIVGKK